MTLPPLHNDVVLAMIDTAGVMSSSVSSIVLLVACGTDVHIPLAVMITETMSPALRVLLENVLLFVPALVPFTFHWYAGF